MTRLFTFCVVRSLKVPLAEKNTVVEGASRYDTGVIAIDVSVALVTFSTVEPLCVWLIALKVALMFAVPWATPVAVAPAIVAADGLSEAQVQSLVMFWFEPSLNAPVAVKLILVRGAIV